MVAFTGAAIFVFVTDEDWKWRLLSSGRLGVSIAIPFGPALQVQGLVPMILQAIGAI